MDRVGEHNSPTSFRQPGPRMHNGINNPVPNQIIQNASSIDGFVDMNPATWNEGNMGTFFDGTNAVFFPRYLPDSRPASNLFGRQTAVLDGYNYVMNDDRSEENLVELV